MTYRQRQRTKQNFQALQGQQGRRCSVWKCPKPTLPVGNLCNRHHKLETRSGSAYNSSLTARTRAPFRRSVQHVLKVLLNRHDEATVMMLQEMNALLNGLSGYPAQNSLRGLPPKERASALLYHIKRQGSRYRSRPANEGAGLRILIHALAIEIMSRAGKLPSSAPRYLKTQVARAVYGLVRSDIRVYETESMRRPGLILKTRVVTKKMSLQSKNVVRHLYSVLEPVYRYWLTKEHVATVLRQKWILAEEVRGVGHVL
jgi:hypothetical protein